MLKPLAAVVSIAHFSIAHVSIVIVSIVVVATAGVMPARAEGDGSSG
jgi:hypothetical protein